MSIRQASHAGSWYSDNESTLNAQLSEWLRAVESSDDFAPPIHGCKAVIAPHAGYSYSGPTAAWAYRGIDTTGISRVIILGPSHHFYLNGCALSKHIEYQTPIGNLPLDLSTIAELRKTGLFTDMSKSQDEDEHSIEMHLPYIRKIFEGMDISIVPILVGPLDLEREAQYGALIAPLLAEKDTICVTSSDFCHWGSRFQYTFYYPSPPPCTPIRLTRSNSSQSALRDHPIHASISALDHEGMDVLTLLPDKGIDSTAAHRNFRDYLSRTKNTICGRHPIGVLMGALSHLEQTAGAKAVLKFVRYEQSSECLQYSDSSVSYASAYVVI